MSAYLGFIAWLIGGGIVGWAARTVMGDKLRTDLKTSIFLGVFGAAFVGLAWSWLTNDTNGLDFNLTSFLVAMGGAVILLAVLNGLLGRR